MGYQSRKRNLYPIGTKKHSLEIISGSYDKIIRGKSTICVDCKCQCGVIKSLSIHHFGKTKTCGCGLKNTQRLERYYFGRRGSLAIDGHKICSFCGVNQSVQNFRHHKKTKDKLQPSCINCNRDRINMIRYGITPEEYRKLLIKQNFCCASCGKHRDVLSRGLVVDHNHDHNSFVRGLICSFCNTGIGMLGDNANGLLKAYQYIKNFEDSLTNSNIDSKINQVTKESVTQEKSNEASGNFVKRREV